MAIMEFSMIMKTRKLKTSAKMHSAGSLVHHCDGTSPLVGNEPPVIISHISWVLEVECECECVCDYACVVLCMRVVSSVAL